MAFISASVCFVCREVCAQPGCSGTLFTKALFRLYKSLYCSEESSELIERPSGANSLWITPTKYRLPFQASASNQANHLTTVRSLRNMESSFLWITFFGSLLTVSDSYLTIYAKEKFVPEKHKNWNNLDHRSCGFSLKDRIIGGKIVRLGKYPWLVRVGRIREGSAADGKRNMVFPCGGAILNRYYILTAGHCFLDRNTYPTLVRVGEYDTTKDTDCVDGYCAPPVQDIPILQHYTPRYFRPNSMENDIALIELEKPIQFSETVLPICLPTHSVSKSNLTNKMAEVAGWGIVNIYTKKTATVLTAVQLKIVENVWCRLYKEKHFTFPFNIICAGSEQGKDSCSGDSGGPLMLPVVEHGTMKYYAVGVVSYGPEACGETNSPGIYTYVPQFELWILNHINRN